MQVHRGAGACGIRVDFDVAAEFFEISSDAFKLQAMLLGVLCMMSRGLWIVPTDCLIKLVTWRTAAMRMGGRPRERVLRDRMNVMEDGGSSGKW